MRESLEEYLERYHKRLKEKEEKLAFVLIQQFSKEKFYKENVKTETWKSAKKRAEKEYDEVRNAKVDMYLFYDKNECKREVIFDSDGNFKMRETSPIHLGKKISTVACKVEEMAETETVYGYKPTSIKIDAFPIEG